MIETILLYHIKNGQVVIEKTVTETLSISTMDGAF